MKMVVVHAATAEMLDCRWLGHSQVCAKPVHAMRLHLTALLRRYVEKCVGSEVAGVRERVTEEIRCVTVCEMAMICVKQTLVVAEIARALESWISGVTMPVYRQTLMV
jgi:hypothetical protein